MKSFETPAQEPHFMPAHVAVLELYRMGREDVAFPLETIDGVFRGDFTTGLELDLVMLRPLLKRINLPGQAPAKLREAYGDVLTGHLERLYYRRDQVAEFLAEHPDAVVVQTNEAVIRLGGMTVSPEDKKGNPQLILQTEAGQNVAEIAAASLVCDLTQMPVTIELEQ